MKKPETLIICGIPYKVVYCEHQSDVDQLKETALWGGISFCTQTIRIFDNNCTPEFIWRNIIHEVLHGIATAANLSALETSGDSTLTGDQKHDQLDALATALNDFLFRNDLIKLDDEI